MDTTDFYCKIPGHFLDTLNEDNFDVEIDWDEED